MKFLGSLFTFALIAISSVFAYPDINQKDDTFRYWISVDTKQATIMGIINTKAISATVKPYLYVEGQKYTVHQIGAGAFSNTALQDLYINSNVAKIHFSPNAFQGAKNIRTITLNTNKVTADLSAFDGCGTNLGFSGKGTESLINDFAKKLLNQWRIPIENYANLNESTRMRALHKLASTVKEKFGVNDKIAYPSNVAVVLALKTGNTLGIARAFRVLALNMGFAYNDVHVGTDNAYYSWNYVYVNKGNGKKWYNLDIVNRAISADYTTNLFVTKAVQKRTLTSLYGSSAQYLTENLNPDNWSIYISQYGFRGESPSGAPEKFYDWLVRNRAGVTA